MGQTLLRLLNLPSDTGLIAAVTVLLAAGGHARHLQEEECSAASFISFEQRLELKHHCRRETVHRSFLCFFLFMFSVDGALLCRGIVAVTRQVGSPYDPSFSNATSMRASHVIIPPCGCVVMSFMISMSAFTPGSINYYLPLSSTSRNHMLHMLPS